MQDSEKRSLWGSKLGFLLAAVGSAVGLGNIWRFSYMAYEHGGGAFLVPYLVALVVAGIPLMILEYSLGHREKGAPPLAFARIGKHWEWLGWWMPTAALFGIMLYYSVIIGWCINYFGFSFNLAWGADPETFFFKDFLHLSDSAFNLGGFCFPIILTTFAVWFLCWFICYREIHHGIEKACMIFMPLLFILTLVLVGWSLTLDGARDAILNFYLKPDWSKINIFNPGGYKVWIAAFGQIFFTLSLGFGIMITYASYLPRKTNIISNALWTTILNCIYSIIAGFTVFGVAGFMAVSQNTPIGEVIKSGPQLAFVIYPKAISELPVAQNIFGVLFFGVLIVAGISSGISLIEAFTCSISDKFAWSRKKAVTTLCVLGFAGSLIFTTKAGLLILDIADHFITNYGLVIAGIIECLLVAWVLKTKRINKHIKAVREKRPKNGDRSINIILLAWNACIYVITPLILAALVTQAFIGEIKEAYGGYSVSVIWVYGVGWLLITLIIAIILTLFKWDKSKRGKLHQPEDEHLLT